MAHFHHFFICFHLFHNKVIYTCSEYRYLVVNITYYNIKSFELEGCKFAKRLNSLRLGLKNVETFI